MRGTIPTVLLALGGVALVAATLYFSLFHGASSRFWGDTPDGNDPPVGGIRESGPGAADGKGKSPQSTPGPGDAEKDDPRQTTPPSGVEITGCIVDDLGFPIPGVLIHAVATRDPGPRVLTHPDPSSRPQPSPPSVTDSAGVFRVVARESGARESGAREAGEFAVLASHPHFAPRVLERALSVPARPSSEGSKTPIDMGLRVLRDDAGLVVNVQSPDGNPIPGATLQLRPTLLDPSLPASVTTMLSRQTKSDNTGTARFLGVPGGPWLLEVAAEGHATASVEHAQRAEPVDIPTLVVTLERGVSLRGQVLDVAGQGVRGALVFFQALSGPRSLSAGPTLSTQCDGSGLFQLDGVSRSRQRVVVFSETDGILDRLLDRQATEPESNHPTDPGVPRFLELRLPRARSVGGRVVQEPSKQPVPDAVVVLWSLRGWPDILVARGLRPSTRTDADGKFRFRGIPEGIFRLTAQSKGLCSAMAAPRWPDPVPGQAPMPRVQTDNPLHTQVVLSLRKGFTLRGRALTAAGKPISGARIELAPVSGVGLAGAGVDTVDGTAPKAHTRSLESGHFALHHTIPGAARLRIHATGFSRFEKVVTGDADPDAAHTGEKVLDVGAIQLRPGGTLRGRARHRSGRPAGNVTVYLVPTDPDPAPGGREPRPKNPLPHGDAAGNVDPAPIRVTCDPSGRFQCIDLAPGWYRVFYDDPNLQSPRQAATTRAETTVRIRVLSGQEQTIDLRPEVR